MAIGTPYITPKRFALGGFGIDTTRMTAPALRATLARATSMVNVYCNGSMLPTPFDFRGGTVTAEQHKFPIPDPLVAYPGSRRVFVNQRPLRTVTGFAIQFTSTYEITLTLPNDVYVNHDQGWCEIVASQPTIIGFPPIGYWYGLYQPIVAIDYTYGYQIAVTDDECEASTPTLYYATYGQWLVGSSVEVTIDEVVVDPGDYTLNYADGSIKFTTAPEPNTVIAATYTTTLPDAITQATGLIAVDLIGQSRNAARGLIGLQSLKVAEVAISQMVPGRYSERNGVRIPDAAAAFLSSFSHGAAA